MSFRVTPSFLSNQLLFHQQSIQSRLATLQFQASSGKRISRPSEDPSAVQKLFSLKKTISSLDTDLANIESVQHTLNVSVTNLQEGHEIVRKAQRLALEALQADPANLSILATEVDLLAERLVEIANAQENDRYLYAGQDDRSPAFEQNPVGSFPPYVYAGSDQSLTVNVSLNVSVDSLYNGREIFATTARQASIFFGTTERLPEQEPTADTAEGNWT